MLPKCFVNHEWIKDVGEYFGFVSKYLWRFCLTENGWLVHVFLNILTSPNCFVSWIVKLDLLFEAAPRFATFKRLIFLNWTSIKRFGTFCKAKIQVGKEILTYLKRCFFKISKRLKLLTYIFPFSSLSLRWSFTNSTISDNFSLPY